MWASVNIWSVLVAAIVSMIIGSIWYGRLFGAIFMKERGMDAWSKEKQDEMRKDMGLGYIGQFIANFVMFYVLAGFIVGLDEMSVGGGMLTSFIIWVGFVIPLAFGEAVWGGKKTLFLLSVGNMFLSLLAAGAIIGAWK